MGGNRKPCWGYRSRFDEYLLRRTFVPYALGQLSNCMGQYNLWIKLNLARQRFQGTYACRFTPTGRQRRFFVKSLIMVFILLFRRLFRNPHRCGFRVATIQISLCVEPCSPSMPVGVGEVVGAIYGYRGGGGCLCDGDSHDRKPREGVQQCPMWLAVRVFC